MPDLKSEIMHKVVAKWDSKAPVVATPTGPIETEQSPGKKLFRESTGVSRAVFDAVHDHPWRFNNAEAWRYVTGLGYPANSVSALLSAYRKQGAFEVRESDGKMRATCDTMPPLKSSYVPRSKKAAAPPLPPPTAAPSVTTALPTPTTAGVDFEGMLGTLNVYQAKLLYQRLQELFA